MYHYVYRITNIKLNKHYYGVRTAKNRTPEEDIGIYYFSSSSDKEFIQDQKDNPDNYKYKVVKSFKTRELAIELEITLHEKFNVGINESFYNLAKQSSIEFNRTGITHNDISIIKMSNSKKGKKSSRKGKSNIEEYGVEKALEISKKMSISSKGRKAWNKGMENIYSEETKKKMAMGRKGKNHTEEHKKYMSECMKGKNIGDNNGMKNRITVRDLRDGKFYVLNKDEFNKDKYNKITKKGYYVGNRSKIKNF